MLSIDQQNRLLQLFMSSIELPDYAYEKAKGRYEDIGAFLGRDESGCNGFSPKIFPQGSFRLGTAIRPLDEREEYDLDLACELKEGLSTQVVSQRDVKHLVGNEIKLYRNARQIGHPVEEKHRCWRLEYEDQLSFHIDTVPCIPAEVTTRTLLFDAMMSSGLSHDLSSVLSELSVFITDDQHPHYSDIVPDWPISNPEGFAQWFEFRMNQFQKSTYFEDRAEIAELPAWKRKLPLQRCVQLLKRHRDQMFKNEPDSKPISIIITTLAGYGYAGERLLPEALKAVLNGIVRFAESGSTEIMNPVNPAENFADKWTMPKYAHLKLRENFVRWAYQAQADFHNLLAPGNTAVLSDAASNRLALRLNEGKISDALGLKPAPSVITPKTHHIKAGESKPWCMTKIQ